MTAIRIALWPLFGASRWRACMAELGVAPGAALLDLSMRRRDHRRFAARCWVVWAFAFGVSLMGALPPMGRILGGVAEWGILLFGIAGVVGAGVSVSAAVSALVAWLLIGLLTSATPWRDAPGAALTVAAAVLGAIGVGGLRYRRRASMIRRLATLLMAPVLAFVAFVPLAVLTAIVYGLASAVGAGFAARSIGAALARLPAGFGEGAQSALGVGEFVMMGMVWGAALSIAYALVDWVRDVASPGGFEPPLPP